MSIFAAWFYFISRGYLPALIFLCSVHAANCRADSQDRRGGVTSLLPFLALAVVGAMCAEFAKTLLLIWNAIGVIDIVFVVFSALRFGLNDWKSMHALRELPLSLLPTFLVPLVIASHVLIFVRLARAGAIRINH
jgi:hypothetical protein